MPGFNLVRNSKVFFTANVDANTGVVAVGSLTAAKTQELAVMNGFSFSQATDAQNITVSEAGNTPARGQRSFNSALQPVEFSFSTYMRPKGATTTVDMDEKVLWNALFASGECNPAPVSTATVGEFVATTTTIVRAGTANSVVFSWASLNLTTPAINVDSRVNIGGIINTNTTGWNGSGTVTAISGTVGACTGMTVAMDIAPPGTGNPTTTAGPVYFTANSAVLRNAAAGTELAHLQITAGLSNKNQLQKFGLIIIMDQATYVIDNCVLDQGQIEFGLDGIAMVQWSGKGTILRTLATGTTPSAGTFGGSLTGNFTAATANTSGTFITNKISTATLKSTFLGQGTSAKTYAVALTGGSLTIANNVSFVTPETLGIVNKPIGYFTGTRSVSGSLTAYLKTGGGNTTSTLLNDLLAAPSETKYYLEIQVGGIGSANKVEIELPAVTMQVPSIDVQDVVSTTINFAAQGSVLPSSAAADLADASSTSYYDVEAANDLLVRYYSVTA